MGVCGTGDVLFNFCRGVSCVPCGSNAISYTVITTYLITMKNSMQYLSVIFMNISSFVYAIKSLFCGSFTANMTDNTVWLCSYYGYHL